MRYVLPSDPDFLGTTATPLDLDRYQECVERALVAEYPTTYVVCRDGANGGARYIEMVGRYVSCEEAQCDQKLWVGYCYGDHWMPHGDHASRLAILARCQEIESKVFDSGEWCYDPEDV